MTEISRETLVVPASLFDEDGPTGFGMDIGGSLMKVAYPVKHGDKIHINLVTFAKSDIEVALGVLKGLLVGLTGPGEQIYTTGVGCNAYAKMINDTLDVRIVNLFESDCNTTALKFMMDNLAFEQCVHPPCVRAYPAMAAEIEGVKRIKEALKPGEFGGMLSDIASTSDAYSTFPSHMSGSTTDENAIKSSVNDFSNSNSTSCDGSRDGKSRPDPEMSNIQFPVLMFYLGSGSFFVTVYPDYTHKFLGINTSCGRTLMGFASLLTGAKTFEELLSLAEAGDNGNVDTRCKHVRNPNVQDLYTMLPDETVIYGFGQTVGKSLSDFKKEDLGAALVSHTAMNIAQGCHRLFLNTDAKTVLFFGGLCSESQHMRDEITRQFGFCLYSKPKTTKSNYYFLKYGTYLGAIGAMLWKGNKQE